jgi:hypothetical protein
MNVRDQIEELSIRAANEYIRGDDVYLVIGEEKHKALSKEFATSTMLVSTVPDIRTAPFVSRFRTAAHDLKVILVKADVLEISDGFRSVK